MHTTCIKSPSFIPVEAKLTKEQNCSNIGFTEEKYLKIYNNSTQKMLQLYPIVVATTPWVKNTRHQTLGHNLTNYYPIFKFFLLVDSIVNLQQIHV